MEPAIAYTTKGPRIGYFRIGVYNNAWDRLVNILESKFGRLLFEMTRRELTLGSQDATTGYYAPTYSDSTIKGIMVPKSNVKLQMACGRYVSYDELLLTADVALVSDQIKTQEDIYYEVMSVEEYMLGDSFHYRSVDLNKIPLYSES